MIDYYLHFLVLKEPSETLCPKVQETIFTANNIFIMVLKFGKLISNNFETWKKKYFFQMLDQIQFYCYIHGLVMDII